ncbi:hypothetical protein P3J6_110327 [Pseudoalteromonas sp. 3J6]|nr:hypothetical protein P3J6_110327 [Pseudoalteromonas sp. 3J6]
MERTAHNVNIKVEFFKAVKMSLLNISSLLSKYIIFNDITIKLILNIRNQDLRSNII